MMKNLLITGFDRFLGYAYNSTEEVLPLFRGSSFGNFVINVMILPTSYNKSWQKLREVWGTVKPDALISFGMRAGNDHYALEIRGINKRIHYDHQLKMITQSEQTYIQNEAPLFRYMPIKETTVLQNRRLKKLPLDTSFNAGNFICNYLIYQTLGFLEAIEDPIPYAFIHIPAFPPDAKPPAKGKTFYQLYHDITTIITEMTQLWEKWVSFR